MTIIGAGRLRRRLITNFIKPKKAERILDMGCGPGTFSLYFPNDVDYVGFDLSENYIEAANKKYGGQKRTFFVGNVETVDLSSYDSFDKVLAIGILHHLNNEQVTVLMDMAMSKLRPGGVLITLDGCFTDPQNYIAQRIISADRGEYVRTQDQYQQLVQPFGKVSSTLLTDGLRIPYTHLIMEIRKHTDIK